MSNKGIEDSQIRFEAYLRFKYGERDEYAMLYQAVADLKGVPDLFNMARRAGEEQFDRYWDEKLKDEDFLNECRAKKCL